MRAGRLRDRIEFLRPETASVDEYGTPVEETDEVLCARAEVVRRSANEFLAGPGETTEARIVFRIRYRSDLSTTDQIKFEGDIYDIEEITEVVRRRWIELRCRRQET